MEERDVIDIELEATKYCVSQVSLKVAAFAMQQTVDAWNFHTIPGVGMPIVVRNTNNKAASVPQELIPSAEDVVTRYEAGGGRLTVFPKFGTDPLGSDLNLVRIRERFLDGFDVDNVYGALVNGMDWHFRNAVTTYCDLTR
ncbi:hypothetical protein AC249_AIPGENE15223 [Exaiptasia diaphana]|nr:hypothetical protein AC249_AIPGENE15223 [Exaiptasia diaphana]